jgi:hypothetical protein
VEGIACSWCHYPNEPGRVSCGTCGAPLDVKNAVSESGWRAAPRLREMAEFRVGDGSWRNWNADPGRWRPIVKEREPMYP